MNMVRHYAKSDYVNQARTGISNDFPMVEVAGKLPWAVNKFIKSNCLNHSSVISGGDKWSRAVATFCNNVIDLISNNR